MQNIQEINIFLHGAYAMLLFSSAVNFFLKGDRLHRTLSFSLAIWAFACFYESAIQIGITPEWNIVRRIAPFIDLMCIPTGIFIGWAVMGSKDHDIRHALLHETPYILAALTCIFTSAHWLLTAIMGWSAIYVTYHIVNVSMLLKRYNTFVRNHYSSLVGRNVNWIIKIVCMLPLIFLVYSFRIIYPDQQWPETLYYIVSSVIWWVTLSHLDKQKQVNLPKKMNAENTHIQFQPLDDEEADNIFPFAEDVERIIMDKRFFRNPDITLEEICRETNISEEAVTHYLLRQVGTTFYDLVNQQRLYFAAELLASSNHNLEQVTRESGFTDISMFQDLFYKEYGCKPLEYRTLK